jgi:hypothetical protein
VRQPTTWTLRAEWPADVDIYGSQLLVTVYPRGGDIAVTVELRYDDAGPYVIGVAARSTVIAGDRNQRRSVSPRDVQRLPLARVVDAVLAFAATVEQPTEHSNTFRGGIGPTDSGFYPDATVRTYYAVGAEDDWRQAGFQVPVEMIDAGRVLEPGERPQRGKPNRAFYKRIAERHRVHQAAGRSPAKEIAKELDVTPNLAHQWIHRARELGDLEPSPRSRRRND